MKNKIEKFLTNIKFSYLQPNESIPENWSKTKSLNNNIFPIDDRRIKHILKHISNQHLKKDYSFTVAGILNKLVESMNIKNSFLYFSKNLQYFHSSIVRNGNKYCFMIDPLIKSKESEYKRIMYPYFKDNHKILSIRYIHFLNKYNHFCNHKIGILYLDSNSYRILNAINLIKFLNTNSIIICNGIYYKKIKNFIENFLKNNKLNYIKIASHITYCENHPTFDNGIVFLKKI